MYLIFITGDEEFWRVSEASSQEDFASKLNWALDNPQEAKEIGINGQKVAVTYFNYMLESKKIIEVIEA